MAIRRRKPAWLKILDADYATKREAHLSSGAGRGKKLGEMGNRKMNEKAYACMVYVDSNGGPAAVRVKVSEKSLEMFTAANLRLEEPSGDTMFKPRELVTPSMIRATRYADPAARTKETAPSGRKYIRMTAPDDKATQSSYSAPICGLKAGGGKAPATVPTMKQLRASYDECKKDFSDKAPAGHSSSLSIEIIRA